MLAKEKGVKASLARTRQVIANKFRKLNRNRILQERELETKYAPITDSINRLIETKTQLHAQKNNSYFNDETEGDELENGMEVDDKHDDLMHFDDDGDVKDDEIDVKAGIAQNDAMNSGKERAKPTDLNKKYANIKKNKSKQLDTELKLLADKKNKQRTEQRANQYDVVRIYGPEHEADYDKKISTRKFSKKPPSSSEKILESTRKSLSSKRKSKRTDELDAVRFRGDKRKNFETEIISPEDYDSDGHFLGLATKRRKVERPVKKLIKRKPVPKRKPAAKAMSYKPELKHEPQKRVIISLDDYNDKGEYVGLAKKRRKIEISEKKLVEKKKERKNQWRSKKRHIKYDGKGLEKTFIPYTENIVYEYYDDPNELVDRLMLLVSSKTAGNTNHDQEINSIVEELRERNIIH